MLNKVIATEKKLNHSIKTEKIESYHTRLRNLVNESETLSKKLRSFQKIYLEKPVRSTHPVVTNVHMKTGGKDGVAIIINHIENMLNGKVNKLRLTGLEEDKSVGNTDKSGIIDGFKLTGESNLNVKSKLCKVGEEVTLDEELELNKELMAESLKTYEQILDYYIENPDKIPDAMIIHNFFSLPVNPAGTIALFNFFNDIQGVSDINLVFLHHDFFAKRDHFKHDAPEFRNIKQFVEPSSLSLLKNSHHLVINNRDKIFLKRRYGLNSTVVYNFDDFTVPDNYRARNVQAYRNMLKKKYNVPLDANIILQGTRTVGRKQIELAVDVIAEINKEVKASNDDFYEMNMGWGQLSHSYLIAFGSENEDEDGTGYYNYLIDYAKEKGVEEYVKFIGNNVTPNEEDDLAEERFSFKTQYQAASGFTYFSSEEGFGNNLLEAIRFSLTFESFSKLVDILEANRVYGEVLQLTDPEDFRFIMSRLMGIIKNVDIKDETFGFPESQYNALLRWIENNPHLVPAIGVLGGEGIGYEVYLNEIKPIAGTEFIEIGSDEVTRTSHEINGRIFKDFSFRDKNSIALLKSMMIDPRDMLVDLFQSVNNYFGGMQNFSYEALKGVILDKVTEHE